MKTQAYFDNIQEHLIAEIDKSVHNIQVAVAWLTDYTIFKKLCSKAAEGKKVELLLVNDNINNQMAHFDHRELEKFGGIVYFINPTESGAIMHHKFCVIDNCTVITGSYNWSNKAKTNDENIIVTWEACDLGTQFQKEFIAVKDKVFAAQFINGSIELTKIIKRLELIKSFVILEERDEILNQVKKIKDQTLTPDLIIIIEHLESARYGEAIRLTEIFINEHSQLTVFNDPEIFALQLEIKSIEIQLNALLNEQIEIEKLITEFSIRHTKELGAIVLEILKLRKLIAISEEDIKEAENEERQYQESYAENIEKNIPAISKEDTKILKTSYREASMLCHPDKFQNEPEKQKRAEEIFKSLSEAYKNNDVTTVESILLKLRLGILISDDKKQPDKKSILKIQLTEKYDRVSLITKIITALKSTDVYLTATKNADWTSYFEIAKQKLQKELNHLQTIVQ